MNHKTDDLTGPLLDQAVALAFGLAPTIRNGMCHVPWDTIPRGLMDDTSPSLFAPSSNWAQGGPIIERERIELLAGPDAGWNAVAPVFVDGIGPTPLIAAMRAFVKSKLGDRVELP